MRFPKRLLSILFCLALAGTSFAQELKPHAGGATPPLVLRDLGGKTHDLRDYRGKVVMVQFWATYCAPCVKEMPSVMRLKEKLAGKPFAILAVNMGETDKEVREFLNKLKVDFTVLMDPDGRALGDWKVFVAPSTFLVDPRGNIRYTLQGATEWDRAEYVGKISELLRP